jgi:hypothetical protein
MAFTIANWACVSSSLNQGQETITPFGGSPTVENAPNIFMYGSPNDTVATIEAANYFLPQYASLSVGDWIMGFGTDASFAVQITAVSSTSVTVESTGLTTNIGTANIQNNAVTYAKIQQTSAGDVLIGNPTGSAANVEEITLGNGLSFSGTTLQVNPGLARQASVALTLAQWNGMYATPVQLLAAPGAGLMNIVDSMYINFVYGSAALTAGGAVGAQYGNTAHAGGVPASSTEAATDFTGASANTMFRIGGGLSTGAATASCINTAIYLSNATQAFATGTGGSFEVFVNYRTVSAS